MEPNTNPVWALVVMVIFVGLVAWLIARHFRRARAAATSAAAAAPGVTPKAPDLVALAVGEQKKLQQLVGKLTPVLPDGRPRCQSSTSCTNPATHLGPKIVRDDGGILEYIARKFGAAQRLRIGEDVWSAPKYCADCVHLARQDFRLKLAEVEHSRIEATRNEEIDLGHYERVGASQRIARLVLAHQVRADGETDPPPPPAPMLTQASPEEVVGPGGWNAPGAPKALLPTPTTSKN